LGGGRLRRAGGHLCLGDPDKKRGPADGNNVSRPSFAFGAFYVTILAIPTLREYLDDHNRSPFARWLDGLATPAALKVRTALARLEAGNTSALRSVGGGVHEVRIDFGPGYGAYLGLDGAELVILLGGSAKARQSAAIADARERWADYRRGKRRGEQETG
jgi:putative addiction module killer protein